MNKIIPKNNDEGRAIYGNLENKIDTVNEYTWLSIYLAWDGHFNEKRWSYASCMDINMLSIGIKIGDNLCILFYAHAILFYI